MKFGEILEYHKIPEWYNMYLNYELFKQKIELFQLKKKFNEVAKLPGYYYRTTDGQLVMLEPFHEPIRTVRKRPEIELREGDSKQDGKSHSLEESQDKMIADESI
jgi:SPX domain protein involved in polyphosphate accumulation